MAVIGLTIDSTILNSYTGFTPVLAADGYIRHRVLDVAVIVKRAHVRAPRRAILPAARRRRTEDVLARLPEVRDAIVYVRLHGSCNGCSMAAVTLREGVEEALRANVPEIAGVEVVPSEPGPALVR